jgi:hypothetical protein
VKISNTTRIVREDLPDLPPGEGMDLLIQRINSANEQTTQALMQNLTIADNMNAAFTDPIRLTHGTEVKIKNPLKVRPVAVHAVRSSAVNGGTRYRVENVDWHLINGASEKDQQQIGITVNFDLEHTRPCLIKTKSGSQSINNNTETALTGFDTTTYSRGSVITDNGSVFTVSEAGTYQVHLQLQWAGGGVTYSALETYLNVTGGSAYYLNSFSPVTYGNAPATVVSGVVRLAAGGSFTPYGYQTNAATAARNVTGGTDGSRIMIHRLYNDTAPQNDVTFVVYGG